MPNQINPIAAPLTAIKQIGEQANVAIQTLGTQVTMTASQGLDTLIAAAPPVPGVPGAPAAAVPNAGLFPAIPALAQVENLIIPAGLPRPSQVMGAPPAPAPAAPAAPPAAPVRPLFAPRVTERRGI